MEQKRANETDETEWNFQQNSSWIFRKISKPYMKKGHTHNTTKLHPLFFIDDRKGTA